MHHCLSADQLQASALKSSAEISADSAPKRGVKVCNSSKYAFEEFWRAIRFIFFYPAEDP